MALPDRSLDPRILESAKQEFLTHGFEGASLKVICEKAGATTGALYNRYKGKKELFEALVADVLADLEAVRLEKSAIDPSGFSDAELFRVWDMDEASMLWWFRFLYERYDAFQLLLKCANGTIYENFCHDWVERITDSTMVYYQEARRRGIAASDLSHEEMHILLTAFWSTIYEPFIHGYTWAQMEAHSALVCHLFNWQQTLGFTGVPD